MLDNLERFWKETFLIPLSYYSLLCLEHIGNTRRSHAGYLMFPLKFQNSSAFGPRQYAKSLALQKKIHCLDQSVVTTLRYCGTRMNFHKLNCPIFADPGRNQLISLIGDSSFSIYKKGHIYQKTYFTFCSDCPNHYYICGNRMHRRHPTVKTKFKFMSA